MDPLPFGFDTDATRALAHLEAAGVEGDGPLIGAIKRRKAEVLEPEAAARSALLAAQTAKGFPPEHVRGLEQEAARRTQATETFTRELEAQEPRDYRSLMEGRERGVGAKLARPHGVDPVEDVLLLQEARAQLQAMPLGDRERELERAAREDDPAYRPHLRAAFLGPTPLTGPPLVRPEAAERIRDWLAMHHDKTLVAHAQYVYQLRAIVKDLRLADWQRR